MKHKEDEAGKTPIQALGLQKAIAKMIDGIIIETDNTIVEVDPIIRATLAAFSGASEQEVTALVIREVEKRGYGVFWNSPFPGSVNEKKNT